MAKKSPQEISSKTPVSVLRQVIQPIRPKAIDPRFDRAFGSFHEDSFKEAYGFVKDIQKGEKNTLEQSLKREKDPRKASAIKRVLDRQKSIEKSKEKEDFRQNVLKQWKRTEREMVAQGKTPFHLKRADQKQLELIAKFKNLKEKSNGQPLNIDKLMEKRRKHKAAKQHTGLPYKTKTT